MDETGTPAPAAATGQLLAGGALIAATVAGAPLLRRRYNRWGATDDELGEPLPGDELVKRPKLSYTRAVTIDAPPEQVWPWLVQLGQGRGGFSSYDAVENLIGCDIHSTDRILPQHQHLRPGDIIRSGGSDSYPCWVVMDVDPPRCLVLQGAGTPAGVQVPDVVDVVPERGYVASTWQWVLRPLDGGRRTRLLVRQRCTYSPNQSVLWHVVEPLNFVMERKMLLGIKARAEDHQPTDDQTSSTRLDPLVAAAVQAPSSHNTQPWRFALDDDRLQLLVDRSRRLPVNDPDDRELLISCGTALTNLVVAASANGLDADVSLCDEPGDAVATVALSDAAGPADDELARAVETRFTWRKAFDDRPLSDDAIGALIEASQAPGTWVTVVGSEQRPALAELVAEGDREQWSDPEWRAELAAWMRPRSGGDGLPLPGPLAPVVRAVLPHLPIGDRVAANDRDLTRDAPLVVVLGTDADDRAGRIRCGMALQRLLLTAAARGIQAGYANQPCQVPPLRRRLAEQLGREHPQLVLRLGHPPRGAERTAPRRPVPELAEVTSW